MAYNPIVCDCHSVDMLSQIITYTGVMCLSDTPYQDLTCSFPSSPGYTQYQCPHPCTCRYSPHHIQQVWVNCSNKLLTTIPSLLDYTMPSHSGISLDLSHNNITKVGDMILPTNIIHLKISDNKIEELTSEDGGLQPDWSDLSVVPNMPDGDNLNYNKALCM